LTAALSDDCVHVRAAALSLLTSLCVRAAALGETGSSSNSKRAAAALRFAAPSGLSAPAAAAVVWAKRQDALLPIVATTSPPALEPVSSPTAALERKAFLSSGGSSSATAGVGLPKLEPVAAAALPPAAVSVAAEAGSKPALDRASAGSDVAPRALALLVSFARDKSAVVRAEALRCVLRMHERGTIIELA
jgi:hypothetical protein